MFTNLQIHVFEGMPFRSPKNKKKTVAHEKSLVLCIVPHLTICSVTAVKKIWPLFINVMEE